MIEKEILLKQLPKRHVCIYCIFFILGVLFLIMSYKIETYDTWKTNGILKCEEEMCQISITLSYNDIDILSKNPKIEYGKKEYDISSISYEEPYVNSNIAYQDIQLQTNLVEENRIINFTILYNKQRIITKIKNIFVERE